MNLEEELRTLESQSALMQQPINENNNNNDINQNVQMNNFNNITNQAPGMNFTAPSVDIPAAQPQYQQPIQNQPAMVDVNQAAQQASGFTYANFEFDINKPQIDAGILPRLAGQANESFRIHILPISPSKIHTHWDAKQGFNFICLKDCYGTSFEKCCITHGNAKGRNVIPILVYPIAQGNVNSLIPNAAPELKVLIINDKKLGEIRQAAATVLGVEPQLVDLSRVDIIARVDNPQYKSHIFNCTPTTMIDQVQQYIPGLIEKWKQVGTPENICKAAARLITREEYEAGYSNYDYKEYLNKQATPTQGTAPSSYTFNTPMQGFQQPYGMNGGINQNQPFYNGQQSTTGFGQNPWQ